MKLYIGIDPGAKGAVGWLRELGDGTSEAGGFDLPTVKPKKGRTQLLSGQLASEFEGVRDDGALPALVVLENVELLPRDGRMGILTGGINWGRIDAVLATLGYPTQTIRARQWKRALGLDGDKAKSITMACGLFPGLADWITERKGADRAEALLLAVIAKRTSEGGS